MDSSTSSNGLEQLWNNALHTLQNSRAVTHPTLAWNSPGPKSIPDALSSLSTKLEALSKYPEAEALLRVQEKATESPNFGGLGLADKSDVQQSDYEEVLFLLGAWLESLNSQERVERPPTPSDDRSSNTRPMTLAEKIFAHHAVSGCGENGLQAGDVIRTSVDWILASELSWASMARTHEDLGSPGIWRNDRFWLAGDHVVHPKVQTNPKIKAMIDASEKAKVDFKMTDYQGMNYTIMHTEFVRERAEPGMLAVGSDSHTCSAGAVGCLSIGLGTADVMMTLALGETWFKVPESIRIDLVGKIAPGMTGKDVILYILQQLKRNTVAGERIVEFTGPGVQELSCDARFAIANMCTEFGAITGVFEPDAVTKQYISRRKRKANTSNSIYFRADPDAVYAGQYTIDLEKVEASVAVYPKPDHVVPVSEMADTSLNGVFIGACTTTEEELVLAALVLKVGLKKGLKLADGKRHYVPGSLPIVSKLKDLGLLEVYEAAGFTRGPPGCSLCVGLSAEKAAEGETWLSSQNRNFENRMGRGAFGHITSAVVCAASSFSMSITDPAPFIKDLDLAFFEKYQGRQNLPSSPHYVEPTLKKEAESSGPEDSDKVGDAAATLKENGSAEAPKVIKSKVVTLGDFIDTDALAPGSTLTTCETDEEFGEHVLELTHPDFRDKVRGGQQVVVAGHAFGVGSSREVAVSALKGVGVKAVIAREFAFIYGRNQPSLGLLGFSISDDDFFKTATEGSEITIDIAARMVEVDSKKFSFTLSDTEYNLISNNGITDAYRKFGKGIWQQMTQAGPKNPSEIIQQSKDIQPAKSQLDW